MQPVHPAPLGFRVTVPGDDSGLLGPAKDGKIDEVLKNGGEINQSCGAFFVRLLHTTLRLASSICIVVAGGLWIYEANSLRTPFNKSSPTQTGYSAWAVFVAAFVLDFAYSLVAWLLSSISMCSADMRGSISAIYAEATDYKDFFRYLVQWITSLIVFIYAAMAMDFHNVQPCISNYYVEPDAWSDQPVGSPTYRPWQTDQAVVNHFYFVSRVQNNGTIYRAVSHVGEDSVCKDHMPDAIESDMFYHGMVYAVAVALIVRLCVNIFLQTCFGADKPWYILPFPLAEKETSGGSTGGQPGGSRVGGERKGGYFTDYNIKKDVSGKQEGALTCTDEAYFCGCFDRYIHNVLGAFRMHEYVGLILIVIAFFGLAGALSTETTQATYIPVPAATLGMKTVAEVPGQLPTSNFFPPDDNGEKNEKYFFFNPWSFTGNDDGKTYNYTQTIYSPARYLSRSTSSDTAFELSSHYKMPYQQACDYAGHFSLDDLKTDGQWPGKDSICYQGSVGLTPYMYPFSSHGEQTHPMLVFAVLVVVGGSFVILSSLAYCLAILGYNVAAIPQSKASGDKGFLQMFEPKEVASTQK